MKYSFVILGISLLSVSACSSVKEQFDFSREAPDEFAVVKRAPLEMPPDYNLRPPRPGASRPQEQEVDIQARQAVFGMEGDAQEVQPITAGEAILLEQTGAYAPNPEIRDIVDRETAEIIEEEKPGIDKLLGKVGRPYEAPADVVDPIEETERLREQQNTQDN